MQQSDAPQDPKFSQDPHRHPHASPKGNFQVLLELEVSESLFAVISGEQGDAMCGDQVVEVNIMRPKKEDLSNNSAPSNTRNSNTIDEHMGGKNRIYRRRATDRRRISQNDKRTLASFFDKSLDLDHEMKVDRKEFPLIELGAAQKILEAYFSSEVSKVCRGGHKIVETLKTALSKLLEGMDRDKISQTLLTSEMLARCEYCGVISYKNSQDSPLASGDVLQVSDENVENYIPTVNSKRDDNVEKTVKLRQMKSQDPNNFDPEMNLEATESLPRRPKAKNIDATSIVNTVTAERKNSSLTENEKTGDASKKTQLKPANQCARSSSVQEKKANPCDKRCTNLNCTRHSTRLVVPKTVKKTGRNVHQDNRIRSNFETLHNTWLKSRRKNFAAPRGDSEVMNSLILKNDQTVESGYSQNADVSLVPEKFSIVRKERDVVASDQESQQSLKSGNWLRKNHALLANGLQKRLRDHPADSKEDRNLAGPWSASSDGKVSTDVESQPFKLEVRSGDKQRSSRSAENPKVNRVDAQMNRSAPSVSLARESPNKKNPGKDYCPENDSNSHTRYNGESETTAFTSSSSENQLRERIDDFKETMKVPYKNPIAVASSDFEYNGDRDEFPLKNPSYDPKSGSFSRDLNDSETFKRQITYDDISSRDISVGSDKNVGSKLFPVHRKILESEDEMDWETFQQLVGTLHPSQKELWRDICKAVSNEAKRVAGKTGGSTEVCIEINPVVKNQAFNFPRDDKIPARTPGTEVSFEMDTILDGFESFLEENFRGAPKAT